MTATVSDTSQESQQAGGLLRSGAGIGAATLFASGANYLSNVVLGRGLGPSEFADAALVVSGLLLLSALALGLQLNTSRAVVAGAGARDVAGRRRRAGVTGVALAVPMMLFAPVLGRLLNMTSSWPIVVLAVGVPVYLVMAVGRGVIQAQHRFGRLAASIGVEAGVRLGVTVACIQAGFGPIGAAIGLVASFAAAAAPCATTLGADSTPDSRPSAPGLSVIGGTVLLLFGQVVISNGDLWVVAARLPDDAGVYAAVALIGRLVFIAAWSIITVVFPSLVADGDRQPAPGLLGRAVAATAGLGALLTLGSAIFARPLLGSMVGDGFADGAPLLWPYALATTLFVMANLIAVADLASGRLTAPALVAGGAVIQTAVLARGAAAGAAWVVWAQVALMGALLLVVAASRLSVGTVGLNRRRPEVSVQLAGRA